MTHGVESMSNIDRVLNAIGRAIYLKDIDSRIVHANDDVTALLGHQHDRVIGLGEQELLGSDNAELLADGAARLIAGMQTEVRSEISFSDEGEMMRLFDVRQRLYRPVDNDMLVLVILRDVTEERHIEQVLRSSEEYARSFLESSQDCVAHLASDGTFLSMNEAGSRMLGMASPAAIIGQGFDAICLSSRETCTLAVAEAVSGGQPRFEQQVMGPEGRERWLDMHLTPIKDIDGSVRSILLVGRDITDLKMLQSQLLQQEKMSSIGQLAAGVAHEINNPMGFVMSNLNTLRKYVDRFQKYIAVHDEVLQAVFADPSCAGERAAQLRVERAALKIDYVLKDSVSLIDESLDGSDRVKRIVQDLKGFSRVDEAEDKLADINAGLESTINIVWNEIKYKATVFKEYGDIPQTRCNLGQLNQVFMNILINAAQAIPESGEIRVRTWTDQERIFVAVSDSGTGIPPEKLGNIFMPFFTTKDVGKGTGLGLSIAYDIVKKHGGNISVQSEIGKGTTFTITIPVIER